MVEPRHDQVAAYAYLTRRDVDLRRLIGVGRLASDAVPIRMLMALYIGPLNAAQLARIAGSTPEAVRGRAREMIRLGMVEDDRREKFREYRLLPRGRKLLTDLIDAASKADADPLLDFTSPERIQSSRMRLRRQLEGRVDDNPYALPCNRR